RPCLENPWFANRRKEGGLDVEQLAQLAREPVESTWLVGAQPLLPSERVYWVERDYYGFNIFHLADRWYAVRAKLGTLDAVKLRHGGYREVWQAETQPELRENLPFDKEQWEEREKHSGSLGRLWRKFRAQPLHALPRRIVRRARR